MQNLLDPAILFFVFGCFAGFIKSNLEIPRSIAKFLSLYLLMALGLKGGFALAQTGLNSDIAISLAVAILMAFIVPALGYQFLKNKISKFDAAAVAASYGSVSAVTFVTAVQFLEQSQLSPNGYMAIALVIMESPAIIMAVLLANML
ncbi:MAG: sodium-dependent bicarbonate transport family permease, partial [Burkholderiaceae bacterium]|nr:sodium-dependent bicarbonate transport family permease [Burkholderiaceae bacterium]